MKTLSITVLIALTITIVVSAQTTKKASHSQIVEQVDIRGNRRISEADIKTWISTHEHAAYSPKKLDGDVRALFDTGHFTDVKVYVEDGVHGGKIITFEVMDRPLILGIDFEGIDSFQQAEVKEEWQRQQIELSRGSEYDPVRIRRAARIIQQLLNNQHSDNLIVIPYVEQQTATEVSVTFKAEKADRNR
jgi:outer membrane protein assembly factor BamA